MGCLNTKHAHKKSQKSKKSQTSNSVSDNQQTLFVKQLPHSTIVSNVDSKYGSKIVQQPNSMMQKQILTSGNVSILSNQIQSSQFNSKYNSADPSVMSTISSSAGSSNVLGSQLNPSDYQSSFSKQSSYGSFDSNATSSMSSYTSSTPYSVISQSSNPQSSYAGSSMVGSSAYSSFAPSKDGSNVVSSGISKYGDASSASSYFSDLSSSVVNPKFQEKKLQISVAITKGPTTTTTIQQKQQPINDKLTVESNIQKLYTPSQIFSKFIDEKQQTSTIKSIVTKLNKLTKN